MKTIEIKIGRYFCEKLMKPIRNKRDILLLLLETLKFISSNLLTEEAGEKGKVTVCIDKMSRVFYIVEGKYFSLLFPFSIEEKAGFYRIYDTETGLEINDKIISLLISVFQLDRKVECSFESVMDFIVESAEEYGNIEIDCIWTLWMKLWSMEDGYIRYDYDPLHEKGIVHPLYHLDVNYSPGVTYKLGLSKSLSSKKFYDILDTRTKCTYLDVN